jgi:hypothetical protein
VSNNWYKKLRVNWLALALVVMLAVGLPLTAAADGTSSVTVGSAEVGVGETVNIPITVYFDPAETAGMGAYVLNVTWDPSVIQVLDVLGGDSPFDASPTANINNGAGLVQFAAVQSGVPGPTGTFTIAYLQVQAIGGVGDSTDLTLTIDEDGFVDAYGEPVEATPINGVVTIVGPAAVGGTAYPINKLPIIALLSALGAALTAGIVVLARRRRKAHS